MSNTCVNKAVTIHNHITMLVIGGFRTAGLQVHTQYKLIISEQSVRVCLTNRKDKKTTPTQGADL